MTPEQIHDLALETLHELTEAEGELQTLAEAAIWKRRAYELEYASQMVQIREVKGHTESTRVATVAMMCADLKLDADLAETVATARAAGIAAATARANLLAALLHDG